jgi:predicted ATPase
MLKALCEFSRYPHVYRGKRTLCDWVMIAAVCAMQVKRAAGSVARFQFDDLCSETLGPADYFAVANAFRIVLVTDVPDFSLQVRRDFLASESHDRCCP